MFAEAVIEDTWSTDNYNCTVNIMAILDPLHPVKPLSRHARRLLWWGVSCMSLVLIVMVLVVLIQAVNRPFDTSTLRGFDQPQSVAQELSQSATPLAYRTIESESPEQPSAHTPPYSDPTKVDQTASREPNQDISKVTRPEFEPADAMTELIEPAAATIPATPSQTALPAEYRAPQISGDHQVRIRTLSTPRPQGSALSAHTDSSDKTANGVMTPASDPQRPDDHIDPDAFLIVEQEADPAVRLYAWTASDEPGITNAVLLRQNETPATVLARARVHWDGLPTDARCIMIAPWLIYAEPPFKKDLIDLVLKGPDLSESKRWWERILWSLEENDLAPHRVALDWEKGMSYWHLPRTPDNGPKQQFDRLWNHEEALSKLPEALRNYTADQIHWKTGRPGVIAWNQYAREVRADTLRAAFTDPLHEKFIAARITNYEDIRYEGDLRDHNGWPLPHALMGDESSPVLYSTDAQRNLDQLRDILTAGGEMPVPWVPYPSYIGRESWEQTMRGAFALGVREFLYWNPNEERKAEGDDAFASQIIVDLNNIQDAIEYASFD